MNLDGVEKQNVVMDRLLAGIENGKVLIDSEL